MLLIGAEAEFDEGAGVGNLFGLPAIVGLEFLHGFLRIRVPGTRGLTRKIMVADESFLNVTGALRVDFLLPANARSFARTASIFFMRRSLAGVMG